MIDRRRKLYRTQKHVLFQALLLMTGLFAIMAGVSYLRLPAAVPVSPLISIVEAKEPAKTEGENLDAPSVEAYIYEVFGEAYGDQAVIIAKCESKLNPAAVGDKDLMSWDAKHNEMVGDSIGIFQIRTGGKGWNRARKLGMSTDEFRVYFADYKNNVNYAYTLFKANGYKFSGTWSCAKWMGVK